MASIVNNSNVAKKKGNQQDSGADTPYSIDETSSLPSKEGEKNQR